MILAALLYIRNVTSTTTVSSSLRTTSKMDRCTACREETFPATCESSAYMDHFCSARRRKYRTFTDQMNELPPIVILRLRNMTAIDATGIQALEDAGGGPGEVRPDVVVVRSARTARGDDGNGRVRKPNGTREYLSTRRSRTGAGTRNPCRPGAGAVSWADVASQATKLIVVHELGFVELMHGNGL